MTMPQPHRDNHHRLSPAPAIALVALAIIIGAGFMIFGGNESSGSTKPSSSPSASKGPTSKDYAALAKAYTITSVDTNCEAIVKASGGKTQTVANITAVDYVVGALQGTPPRAKSDSLSTPLSGKDPTSLLQQVKVKICQDPLLGVTVANMYSTMTVADVNLLKLNPWLAPYAGSADALNTKAAGFMPLLDITNPTAAQNKAAVTQGQQYAVLAEKLDTMLGRGTNAGVQTQVSTLNYDLTAGGQMVGGVPAVQVDSIPDSLPALQIQITLKGACAPVEVYGFNTLDTRPEIFKTPVCVVPSTTHPAPPSGTTGCTHDCGGGGCTHDCGGTTTHPATPTPTPTPTTSHPGSPTPTPSKSCTICDSTTKASQPVPTPASPTNKVTQTSGPGPSTTGPGEHGTTEPPGGNTTKSPSPVSSTQPGGGGNNSSDVPLPKATCGPLSDSNRPC